MNTEKLKLSEQDVSELYAVLKEYAIRKYSLLLKYKIQYFLLNIFYFLFAILLFAYPYNLALEGIANTKGKRQNTDFSKLLASNNNVVQVINYINTHLSNNVTILSLCQGELAYYGKRRFISEYDPCLIGLYSASTTEKAYDFLKSHGIDYIYLPAYILPEYLNSKLSEITANPELTRLVFESNGFKLFSVNKNHPLHYMPIQTNKIDQNNWDIIVNRNDSQVPYYMKVLTLLNPFWLFSDNYTVNYYSPKSYLVSKDKAVPYLLVLHAHGHGLIRIYIVEEASNGQAVSANLEWAGILKKDVATIKSQFLINSSAKTFKVYISLRGEGDLNIKDLAIYQTQVLQSRL